LDNACFAKGDNGSIQLVGLSGSESDLIPKLKNPLFLLKSGQKRLSGIQQARIFNIEAKAS
jgi:hypothetical protein